MPLFVRKNERREVRRNVQVTCQVVRERDFSLISEHALDLSPDGTTIYVSNEETAEMSVLDLASGTIKSRVKIGEEPEGVTVRPDGREVYVTPIYQMYLVHLQDCDLDTVHQITRSPKDLIVRWARDSGTVKPAAGKIFRFSEYSDWSMTCPARATMRDASRSSRNGARVAMDACCVR